MAERNPSLERFNSEPDVNETYKTPPNEYVHLRYKRPRSDDIKDQLNDFKKEMKEMISSLMLAGDAERVRLRKDITDIKTKIEDVKRTNIEIEKSMDFISNKFEEAMVKIDTLENESRKNRAQIQILQEKLDSFERTSFKSTIEMRNFPAKDKETINDLTSFIINTGKALDLDVQPSEIRDAWRLPGKPGSNRTILAEFTTVATKAKFLQQTRSFNQSRSGENKLNTEHIGIAGKRSPVYISEHLTSASRKLYYMAREFAKENKYKFCWTSHGRIFLRKEENSKQIIIKSEKCLTDLKDSV